MAAAATAAMVNHRLPKSILPHRYDLELQTDLETCKFKGKLLISVDIVEPTTLIILNVADLTINDASVCLRYTDTQVLYPSSCVIDEENEILVLEFENGKTLSLGSATLSMEYQGFLNEKLDSFYRSSYEIGGLKKNMAVTTFEPADARRCFPCWDEPDFKAIFKITVHAPADRMVLSNMPVMNETINGLTKVVEFEESAVMSTYVVAIVIGEFEYIEATSEDGVLVRLYTRHGDLHKGKFGFDIMLKLLPFYSEYFHFRYPLPKLDIVSVPVFKAGALENFGLIVFKDEALFVDKNSSPSQKEEVTINVAHEVAHMWFGNIVTLEWWTHLWLNEGMATWISYLAVDYLFPEWEIWMEFNKVVMHALKVDGLEKSHPVQVEVGHAHETSEVFDAISYDKGASVVHMLQHYLGQKDLRRGLISYLEKFAFSNAKSDDLWDSFQEVTGKPVRELMTLWTKQKGYPVVKATLLNDHELLLEQSQFLANGQPGEGRWMVPIAICAGSYDGQTSMLLVENKHAISVPAAASWIKLNAGQTGFFRVHYDDRLQASLKVAISSGSLSAIDRLGILDDTFGLCQAGKQSLSALLSLLEAYKEEAHPTVLSRVIDVATTVSVVMTGAIPSLSRELKLYLAKLLEAPARRFGWEAVHGESHLSSTIRESLLYALVILDHQETITEAKRCFENRLGVPLAPVIMKAVYRSIMEDASASNRVGYDTLLEIYRTSDNFEERRVILSSLAVSSDPAMVREALNFSLSSEVHPQDMEYAFAGICEHGSVTAWTWLKENWDRVYEHLGEGFLLRRVISYATSQLWSNEVADDIREFMSSRISKTKRSVAEFIEKVCLRAQWLATVRDEEGLEETVKGLLAEHNNLMYHCA